MTEPVEPSGAAEGRRAAEQIDVSVVIPTLNGAATIAEQLDALMAQTFSGSWEIVVGDNGSTDCTHEIVAAYAGRVPAVRMAVEARRTGANAARNAGIRIARGAKILLCDCDDIVAPGWVAAMARGLDAADGVGGMLEYRRLNPHLQHLEPQSAVFQEAEVPAPVPLGACSGWRRSVFDRIGLFDESWPSGGDDIEFALRAARAGISVQAVPDAILHKRERVSRKSLVRAFFRYGVARPRLSREFPDLVEARRTGAALRQWRWIAGELVRGRGLDHGVLQAVAKNAGRLAGCWKHRSWSP